MPAKPSTRRRRTPPTTPAPTPTDEWSAADLGWANRLVDGVIHLSPPDQLLANPLNARRHPGAQRDALRSALDSLGWLGVATVNVRSGNLIDGHARVEEALTKGAPAVPFVYVDLSPDEERAALLTYDPIGAMATYDGAVLDLLREGLALPEPLDSLAVDLDAMWPAGEHVEFDTHPGGIDPDDDGPGDGPGVIDGHGLVYDDDTIIDVAFAYFRDVHGFPHYNVPTYLAMQQINALARTPSDRLVNSTTAYHVADQYQPHRLSTPVAGHATPLGAFSNDTKFRHALRLALDAGAITPNNVANCLLRTRGASQFRPGFALSLYRRFAPSGGTVLDTSTGFGGRLIAFFASDLGSYIGVDPEPATCDGNRRMIADLCPPGKRATIIEAAAEDVKPSAIRGRVDFAFTSPPYFSKEQYGESDAQSWRRYATPDAWRAGFLVPMLRLQYAKLAAGAHAAVNIADVTVPKFGVVPLESWTVESAVSVGFDHVTTERFPMPRVTGTGERPDRFEPVIVLRKPA